MIEGLSSDEILDYADALRRRGNFWRGRLDVPWGTLSGFANADLFRSILARSWPMFPLTGDYVRLLKMLDWNAPLIPISIMIQAIPCDEISFY
jgi:hypothetical protein